MDVGTAWLAWREILHEILTGIIPQENVSPEWLRNPETGRRLTLDVYYPELRLAIQFVGAHPASRRRRESEEEREAAARREAIRVQVCADHGVTLVVIDLTVSEPWRNVERLYTGLGTAMRRLAHAEDISHERKVTLMDTLSAARSRLQRLRPRLRRPEDLDIFAAKWRDRETRALRSARRSTPQSAAALPRFVPGMSVEHERFGTGVVVAVRGEGQNQEVVVDFPGDRQRTFLVSLVVDKLRPLPEEVQ